MQWLSLGTPSWAHPPRFSALVSLVRTPRHRFVTTTTGDYTVACDSLTLTHGYHTAAVFNGACSFEAARPTFVSMSTELTNQPLQDGVVYVQVVKATNVYGDFGTSHKLATNAHAPLRWCDVPAL